MSFARRWSRGRWNKPSGTFDETGQAARVFIEFEHETVSGSWSRRRRVVLDAFSRRVIGWALNRTLEVETALAAPRVALIEKQS